MTTALANWLETRRAVITGSEIAALAGLSKWETPWSIHQRKTGRLGPVEETEAMVWGNLLEGPIFRRLEALLPGHSPLRWSDLTALLVEQPADVTIVQTDRAPVLVNETLGVGGTPDGILTVPLSHPWLIETKTVGSRAFEQWEKADSPPPIEGLPGATRLLPESYELQVHTYMGLTGLRTALVTVLVGGQRLECHKVEFNPAYFARLCELAREALQAIADGVEPAFDPYADGDRIGEWSVGMTLRPEPVRVDDPHLVTLARTAKAYAAVAKHAELHAKARKAALQHALVTAGIEVADVDGVGRVKVTTRKAQPEKMALRKAQPASRYLSFSRDELDSETLTTAAQDVLALPLPTEEEEE